MAIDRFVLKMQLRKALGLIKGLRPHINDADEDIIVLKLARGARRCGLRDREEAGQSLLGLV
jgi:hypothetical protein